MKNSKFLLSIVVLCMILCSCQDAVPHENTTTSPESPGTSQNTTDIGSDNVTVNGKAFSVEQINEGIKSTMNDVLYYYGSHYDSDYLPLNAELVLGKNLEYELYFASDAIAEAVGEDTSAVIYFVITNAEHRLSTEEDPKLYEFGIILTEYGLQSDFFYEGNVSAETNYTFLNEETVYLGSYSLCLDTLSQPAHEVMSDAWKTQAEEALRLYMDENDFYGDPEDNLQPGKYRIYIQGFNESDYNSTVVFEHENGSVYSGFFYFVHHVTGESPANLNHVSLVEDCDTAPYQAYLENVRSNAALVMEYSVS